MLSINKYVVILLMLALVSMAAYGFWERSEATAANAHAATLSDQLTRAQADLSLASKVKTVDSTQSLQLGQNLDFNFKGFTTYTQKQVILEKVNAPVADYVSTRLPTDLGRLLDCEDAASGDPSGDPICKSDPTLPAASASTQHH